MTADAESLSRPGASGWSRWRRASGADRFRVARRRVRAAAANARTAARALFGGGDDAGELVTVYTANTPEEAWIVRGRLVANGVPAIVARASGGSVWGEGVLGVGVPVKVPRAMAERAEAVLGAEGDVGEDEG